MSKYLVTGTAGFIGFHLANALLERGEEVVGIDNINDYYDVNLKYARLNEAGIRRQDTGWLQKAVSTRWPGYSFVQMDLGDRENLDELFKAEKFDYVIHLAAQAGVRYSIDNPGVYIQSNINGFYNILEACRHYPVKYLLYASSSSVYGNNEKVPFSEDDNVDHPVSLYAATKKSNELMASAYSHLYGTTLTGLRFFTVYGPWGRPDMAVYKFTEAIMQGRPLQVYANGTLQRDFTYIDDIVNGMLSILDRQKDEKPPALMNIGNHRPETVSTLVSLLEKATGGKAIVEYLPMQPGDVRATFADISRISGFSGFSPETDLETGLQRFVDWYRGYAKKT
ncbi:MAG: NAD-dependent epimerase/dehydratase family protein [Bacteroidales bacterium]|nr:NAD-dependent epimerase/dehydratase family protein [Bacteroidales bacterium]